MKRKRQAARRALKRVKLWLASNYSARTNGEIAEMAAVEDELAEIEAALKEE